MAGWWKTKLRKDDQPQTARYSLIVEIDAEGTDVDLYAEIQVALAAQIAAQLAIEL
ncbi:hypothetical protein D3C85_1284320 [compost metagenome]